jgi:hypothetical protein
MIYDVNSIFSFMFLCLDNVTLIWLEVISSIMTKLRRYPWKVTLSGSVLFPSQHISAILVIHIDRG